MNKKGQIRQIFVWIFVLIVAVAIIFYGMKVINKTGKLKDDVLVVKFFNDLDKKISQYYYLDMGSSGKESFSLPGNVEYVCFVKDSVDDEPGFVDPEDINLMDGLMGYSDVFIGPMKLYEKNNFKLATKIKIDSSPECFIVVNGVLNIDLENKGVDEGVWVS